MELWKSDVDDASSQSRSRPLLTRQPLWKLAGPQQASSVPSPVMNSHEDLLQPIAENCTSMAEIDQNKADTNNVFSLLYSSDSERRTTERSSSVTSSDAQEDTSSYESGDVSAQSEQDRQKCRIIAPGVTVVKATRTNLLPKKWGACAYLKENANFWSSMKKDELVVECVRCRVGTRILNSLEGKPIPRDREERAEFEDKAKKSARKFLQCWKRFMLGEGIIDPVVTTRIFTEAYEKVDTISEIVFEEKMFSKASNIGIKMKIACALESSTPISKPSAAMKRTQTSPRSDFNIMNKKVRTSARLTSGADAGEFEPGQQTVMIDPSNNPGSDKNITYKTHYSRIRERLQKGLRMLDTLESYEIPKIPLDQQSVQSEMNMVNKLDGMLKNLEFRIDAEQWDDSFGA